MGGNHHRSHEVEYFVRHPLDSAVKASIIGMTVERSRASRQYPANNKKEIFPDFFLMLIRSPRNLIRHYFLCPQQCNEEILKKFQPQPDLRISMPARSTRWGGWTAWKPWYWLQLEFLKNYFFMWLRTCLGAHDWLVRYLWVKYHNKY